MKTAAAFVAVFLAVLFKYSLVQGDPDSVLNANISWTMTWFIGLAAVPLAPIAKDLTAGLNDALAAWRQIGNRSQP